MRKTIHGLLLITLVVTSLALAGCGGQAAQTPTLDPDQVYTEVAQTVQAKITENANLTPHPSDTPQPTETQGPTATLRPSSTPLVEGTALPSLTAAPGSTQGIPVPTSAGTAGPTSVVSPDQMLYISQKVPDGATYKLSEGFTQVWTIQNTGTTTWDDRYLVRFYAGTRFDAVDASINQTVKPGAKANISVDMRAPKTQGEYTGIWVITNPDGRNFGSFTLTIKAKP